MTKQVPESDEFSNLLLDAVDKTLSSLGEKPKSAVYLYLEKVSNMPKSAIPAKIDEFSDAIGDIFGIGARFLEISIIQNLHSKVGFALELKDSNSQTMPDFTFTQYVSFVKKSFEEAHQREEMDE